MALTWNTRLVESGPERFGQLFHDVQRAWDLSPPFLFHR